MPGNYTKYVLQNLPSCVVAHVLSSSIGQNEFVLDMCAAPGGKTSHLASLIPKSCRIVACDKSKQKVQAMVKRFEALQCSNSIVAVKADSTRILDQNETRSVHEVRLLV